MNTATLNLNLFTKSKSLGKLESAVEEEGMAFLRHALGALTRLLLHTETTRRSVKLSCNSKCVNANQRIVGRLFHLFPGSIAFDLIGTQISRDEGSRLSEIAAKIHSRKRRQKHQIR